MISVTIDRREFDRWNLLIQKQNLRNIQAIIFNLVPYVPFLEFGSSRQAPVGMARISLPEIEGKFRLNMLAIPWNAAFHKGNLRGPMMIAVDDGAVFGQLLIRSRTPIETGRARRGWRVIRSGQAAGAALARAVTAQRVEARVQPRIRGLIRRTGRTQ